MSQSAVHADADAIPGGIAQILGDDDRSACDASELGKELFLMIQVMQDEHAQADIERTISARNRVAVEHHGNDVRVRAGVLHVHSDDAVALGAEERGVSASSRSQIQKAATVVIREQRVLLCEEEVRGPDESDRSERSADARDRTAEQNPHQG